MIKGNQKLLNFIHILLDALMIVLSFGIAYHLRFDEEHSFLIIHEIISEPLGLYGTFKEYMQLLFFVVPGYLLAYYFFNLYNPKRAHSRKREILNLFKANAVGILYTTSALWFIKEANYARLFLVIFAICNISFDVFVRMIIYSILKQMRRRGLNKKHVLLIGYSRATEGYIDRLCAHPEWGYEIHGILDNKKKIGKDYRGIHIIGTISQLSSIIEENDYDEIVVTLGLSEYKYLEEILAITEKSGIHTKFVPDYNNILPTKPYTEDLDGIPVVHVRKVPLSNSFNSALKRAVDIFGALVALTVFSIPMIIVSIIIKITSPGPLIYKQERVGLHNRTFMMYKFRSMDVQDPKKEKTQWTVKNDPRVTPIGKFIRGTSIDELPQIFNILKGDMSLVGPRPERPHFVEQFKEEIPRYMVKHQVRPGLTGWAQVNGYRGDTSIKLRIDCDLYYIENWTLSLDFKIIFLTFFKGFVNKNAY